MTLNLTRSRQPQELRPRIIVFGIGGAGCNAVNNMIRLKLEGVECAVANTDAQALALCVAERKIQLGLSITQGLGAGSRPEIGRAAAEEAWDDISAQIQGAHMIFITAGMGGGTGTGAAPVIARAAREQGLLTVGVVTKPFHFEGAHRMRLAEQGLQELQEVVDTLIVIPNQNLFRVANEKTTFADAFHMADTVLYSGVRGITDLMVMPGLINLDFADIRTVMSEMGKAMMGSGEAEGANRAIEAAERAISNPLLDDTSMAGARGLLINITGGPDLTLFEVDEAANRVRDEVDPQANIIFGSAFDESLKGRIRVSVFATGIDVQIDQKKKAELMRAGLPRPVPVRTPIETPEPQFQRPVNPPPPRPAPEPAPLRPAAAATPNAPIPRRAMETRREPAPPASAAPAAPRLQARADIEAAPPAPPAPPSFSREEPAAAPLAPNRDEQPDMFGAGEEPPRAAAERLASERPQMERPRAASASPSPQPPRFDAPVRPPTPNWTAPPARGRVVAQVDDGEPRTGGGAERAHRVSEPSRDPAQARGARPSIFNLWRSRRVEEETRRSEPEAVTVRGLTPEHTVGQRTPQPQSDTPPRSAASGTAAEPTRRTKEDDVLEIPAFLRRQAN
jgi:cell division protein FtsZ